jgi:hypothetical protein
MSGSESNNKPVITSADLNHGVEMGKINDGYFSNPAMAQSFLDIALVPLMDDLGSEVQYASFGGGEGYLPAIVVQAIRESGREVNGLVVDANPDFLHLAQARGLQIQCTDLEEVVLSGLDLITMRSVNHYNAPQAQQRILERCLASLKPGGWCVSQNLSGPSEDYCRLASDLSRIPELGRVDEQQDRPHITSQAEFNGFMKGVGFDDVRVAGLAPDIIIGPAYYWVRFNGKAQAEAVSHSDAASLEVLREREQHFLRRANEMIETFMASAPPGEAALIEQVDSSYSMPLHFPIHLGRCPAMGSGA